MLCQKGQSILEYTLILGAVIAVLAAALLNSGGIKDKIGTSYDKVGNALENAVDDLTSGMFYDGN